MITANAILFGSLVTPLLTYYFRNEFEQILTLTEAKFFASIQIDGKKVQASKRRLVQMFIVHTILISTCMFIHPLMLIYSEDSSSLNNLDFHLIANPWIGEVQTKTQYYKIFAAQAITGGFTFLTAGTTLIIVLISGHEFYVAFLALQKFLTDSSTNSRRKFEQIFDITAPSNVAFESKADEYEKNCQELLSSMVTAIRVHQIVRKYVEFI